MLFSVWGPVRRVLFGSVEGSDGIWQQGFVFAAVRLDLRFGKQCFEVLFALEDLFLVSVDFEGEPAFVVSPF